jgi:DNA-binding IclR family transcriptional regulator
MAHTAPERAIVCHHAATSTLLALLRLYERDGRATVRGVAAERGCALNSAHDQLVELRSLGLVTWEDGRAGTLRPLVAVVR